jgi:CxxC motif-containing protein (DUF1111 family)
MSVLRAAIVLLCIAAAVRVVEAGQIPAGEFGRVKVETRGDLPFYQPLAPLEWADVDLGHQVFNTGFVAAGTPGAGRRAGLGPLFNLAACEECHNDGARGTGPTGDGEVPASFVLQLSRPGRHGEPAGGDPVYGRTLNTSATLGHVREGRVYVRYETRHGAFADGSPWKLRVPYYEVREPGYGPLAADTVLMPRVPPAIFGVGLLEAVIAQTGTGRFGWQGGAISVRDQTTKAAAREMGMTSIEVPRDDCTSREVSCRKLATATPEFDPRLLDALVKFEQRIAVPSIARDAFMEPQGAELFARIGCAGCHSPTLPIDGRAIGNPAARVIHPYSDLRLHDLGAPLADMNVAGQPVASRWRTAPLWAIGYRARPTSSLTFLHDGRARSVEEAILWHDGEAHEARARYAGLSAPERALLDRWVLGR